MSAHLYIHTPFCSSKCLYCDFYSIPGRNADRGRFIDALTAEALSRRDELPSPPDTIYFGGGTPSLWSAGEAAALLERMTDIFGRGASEITIELNPDDVTPDYIDALHEAGYNRFSMGVQCFHDRLLRMMGRRHTAEEARRAFRILADRGSNVSIDLIFGLPGQTPSEWRQDVEEAIAMRPQHISCYALMLEEGTALTRLVESGHLSVPDDRISADMYTTLRVSLAFAGYRHYEISNFALPGFESCHNTAYWLSRPYLGLGPGAHSYDGLRTRRSNPSDVNAYMLRYADGHADAYTPDIEHLTDTDLRHEYLLTRLRTSRGISMQNFANLFGPEATDNLRNILQPHIAAGTIVDAPQSRLRIAEHKWLIADSIISDLF